MPPDTNHGARFAGQALRLGRRKPVGTSCRLEVVAALAALTARDERQAFTVREVYAQMQAMGTSYVEATVFKTMQRMKEVPVWPPYARLERVAKGGFRRLEPSA